MTAYPFQSRGMSACKTGRDYVANYPTTSHLIRVHPDRAVLYLAIGGEPISTHTDFDAARVASIAIIAAKAAALKRKLLLNGVRWPEMDGCHAGGDKNGGAA